MSWASIRDAGVAQIPHVGSYLAERKAQEAEDEAREAAQAASQEEIARRARNIAEIRTMYGITPEGYDQQAEIQRELRQQQALRGDERTVTGKDNLPTAGFYAGDLKKAEQYRTARIMGAKIAGDVRQIGEQARSIGTAQNLAASGAGLTAANTAAAATGTTGSSLSRAGQAGVMGRWLAGRQATAANAANAQTSALARLASDRASLEAATSGKQDISRAMSGYQQIAALNAARAQIPVRAAGTMANNAADFISNYMQMNAMNENPDMMGGSNPLSSRSDRSGGFEQRS